MKHLNQCDGCGRVFEAKQARTKSCSAACRERARWWAAESHPPYARICERCGSSYAAVKRTQRFCSRRCRNTVSTLARSRLTCCECGEAMFNGADSKPQGVAKCRPCRKANPSRKSGPHSCPDCGASCYGEVCRACRAKRQIVRAPDDGRLARKQREQAAPGIRPCERQLLLAKWKRQGRACVYCDRPADTIDHAVPLVRGGTNYEGNLVPACRRCNGSKGGRLVVEWRAGRSARRMTKPLGWKRKAQPIKAIEGKQLAFNVCPECGSLCLNRYCNNICNTRYLGRRNYRLKVGIPLDAPLSANGRPRAA